MRHLKPLAVLAATSIVWTWPLPLHFRDHIPGLPGDNYSFLWNLWWMRKALSAQELDFFHSAYLFSPFGVDLINHPHTALQGYISATALAGLTIIEAENLYIIISVFLNAVCAYALAVDIASDRRLALLGGNHLRRLAIHRGSFDGAFRSAHCVGHSVLCAISQKSAARAVESLTDWRVGRARRLLRTARITMWSISRCSGSSTRLRRGVPLRPPIEARQQRPALFTIRYHHRWAACARRVPDRRHCDYRRNVIRRCRHRRCLHGAPTIP